MLEGEIDFFVRIPKSYLFTLRGVKLKSEMLLKSRGHCRLDNIQVLGFNGLSVEMRKGKDKKGQEDIVTVLTNTVSYKALGMYKKRWSIEAMFQDFKGQGFDLESTHIQDHSKLVKLLYLVSVAYVFCIHVGFDHEKENGKIPLKNHGYRAYSLFRKGLDILRKILHKKTGNAMELWYALIDKFIHFLYIKMLKINYL